MDLYYLLLFRSLFFTAYPIRIRSAGEELLSLPTHYGGEAKDGGIEDLIALPGSLSSLFID